MGVSNRGFASMDPVRRSYYASLGGHKSGGNFAKNPTRASEAGRVGAAHQPIEAKRLGGRNSHKNSDLSDED